MKNRVTVAFLRLLLLAVLTGCPVRESYYTKECLYNDYKGSKEYFKHCRTYQISKPIVAKEKETVKKTQTNNILEKELGIQTTERNTEEHYDNENYHELQKNYDSKNTHTLEELME